MLPETLCSIGLISGIIGGVMIFIWGPPQPNFNSGVALIVEDNTIIDEKGTTAKEYADDQEQKKSRFKRYSSWGLILIIIGFVFQLIAIWI